MTLVPITEAGRRNLFLAARKRGLVRVPSKDEVAQKERAIVQENMRRAGLRRRIYPR